MRKPQVLKFWADLQLAADIASVVRKYKNQDDYRSDRTLTRYAQAYKGFKEEITIEDLSIKIGWTIDRLKRLRAWWEETNSSSKPVIDDSANYQRAHLLEISGHAGELREAAVSLDLELGSPLEHLLGFFNLPAKPIVNLELGEGIEVFEDLLLLAALKSHTLSNSVWDLMEQWTRKLGDVKRQWPDLCSWVETQPQVFQQLQVLQADAPARSTPGLALNFAKTVVLASLTDAYLDRSEEYLAGLATNEYEIQGPNPLYVLSWNSYESHVVAVDKTKESLDSQKYLHQNLRSILRKTSSLKELLPDLKELGVLRKTMGKELSGLARLPFTGVCERCQSWPVGATLK